MDLDYQTMNSSKCLPTIEAIDSNLSSPCYDQSKDAIIEEDHISEEQMQEFYDKLSHLIENKKHFLLPKKYYSKSTLCSKSSPKPALNSSTNILTPPASPSSQYSIQPSILPNSTSNYLLPINDTAPKFLNPSSLSPLEILQGTIDYILDLESSLNEPDVKKTYFNLNHNKNKNSK